MRGRRLWHRHHRESSGGCPLPNACPGEASESIGTDRGDRRQTDLLEPRIRTVTAPFTTKHVIVSLGWGNIADSFRPPGTDERRVGSRESSDIWDPETTTGVQRYRGGQVRPVASRRACRAAASTTMHHAPASARTSSRRIRSGQGTNRSWRCRRIRQFRRFHIGTTGWRSRCQARGDRVRRSICCERGEVRGQDGLGSRRGSHLAHRWRARAPADRRNRPPDTLAISIRRRHRITPQAGSATAARKDVRRCP